MKTLIMFVFASGLLHVVLGTVLQNEHKGHALGRTYLSPTIITGVKFLKKESGVSSGQGETAKRGTAHWVSAVLLIPFVGACGLAAKTDWNKPVALSAYDAGLFFLFMVVCAGSRMVIHETKGSSVQSTLAAGFILLALKAILSFGLLVSKKSMSFGAIFEVLRQKEGNMHIRVWIQIAVLSPLQCGSMLLSFFVLQVLPPLSFQLLLNCIIVFIAPLQWLFLGRATTPLQFVSLLLLVVGGGALCAGGGITSSSGYDHQSQSIYIFGVVLMFAKLMIGASYSVLKEKFLKELSLPIDANNLVSYCFCLALYAVVSMICFVFSTSTSAVICQEVVLAFVQVFANPWMLCSVLVLATYGIIITYLLKARSAMEKELASIGVVAILAIGPALAAVDGLFHTFECALIILISSLAYLVNEQPAKLASQPAR